MDAGERAALRVLVRHRADAIAAAAMVRALVRAAGGSVTQASTVATATTELAQNIVSHANGNGEILVWLEGHELVVRARDWGSNAQFEHKPEKSLRGLGQGQASVRRMMDRVEQQAVEGGGLEVTARVRILVHDDRSRACR